MSTILVGEVLHLVLGAALFGFFVFAACVCGVKTLRYIRGIPDMVWIRDEVFVPLPIPTWRERILLGSVIPMSCFCVWAGAHIGVVDHLRLFEG